MPSRTITLLIFVFWLATIGWFVGREVLPNWLSDDPPAYTIELADEAQRHPMPTRWLLTRNGKNVGAMRTTLRYLESTDTFELLATSPELALPAMNLMGVRIAIQVRDYDDRIRVTRDGELRAMSTATKLTVRMGDAQFEAPFEIAAWVQDGRLERRGRLQLPGQPKMEIVLESIESPRGRILNPTHPVPRITGLSPGQHWRQTVVDPRTEIASAVVEQQLRVKLPASPKSLAARVLAEVQPIKWNGEMHQCFVIEYRGEDMIAHTWVRVTDGTVLRQEAESHGESLILQRE